MTLRVPKYLSSSAIQTFYKDRTEYYLRYICPVRQPRMGQTLPMSIGSAFDAYAKSYLAEKLGLNKPELEFDTIFPAQVDEANRDWALKHGKHVFEQYRHSGALADLLIDMRRSSIEPQFEFKIQADIPHEAFVDGIPLLGYPDLMYQIDDLVVVRDWKVNGYCGKAQTSPKKGYLMCRDGWDSSTRKHSRSHMTAHKDAWPLNYHGVKINASHPLEDVDDTWATQLSIYGWLLGEPVGGDFVVGIEQLCGMGNGGSTDNFADIRIAAHSCRISRDYQFALLGRIVTVWQAVTTGDIFPDNNEETIAKLNMIYGKEDMTPNEKWKSMLNRNV